MIQNGQIARLSVREQMHCRPVRVKVDDAHDLRALARIEHGVQIDAAGRAHLLGALGHQPAIAATDAQIDLTALELLQQRVDERARHEAERLDVAGLGQRQMRRAEHVAGVGVKVHDAVANALDDRHERQLDGGGVAIMHAAAKQISSRTAHLFGRRHASLHEQLVPASIDIVETGRKWPLVLATLTTERNGASTIALENKQNKNKRQS